MGERFWRRRIKHLNHVTLLLNLLFYGVKQRGRTVKLKKRNVAQIKWRCVVNTNMSIIQTVINNLIRAGNFSYYDTTISDKLRLLYAYEYAEVTGGSFHSLSSSNKKYALKLAGLNLKKAINSDISGFVYCVSNPSFVGYVKIGISKDIKKRLASYQTYDPHRAYKIETYSFVEDKRALERELLNHYKVSTDRGEWLSDLSVIDYIKNLK